jgi:hypothetical protein
VAPASRRRIEAAGKLSRLKTEPDLREYFRRESVIGVMNTAHPPVGVAYGLGYTRGRYAAKVHIPAAQNPFQPGTSAYHGWNDGYYDEESARRIAIEGHAMAVWSHD